MKTVNISLTAEQAKFVDNTTKSYGFANRSEFVRALLRFASKTNRELIGQAAEAPFTSQMKPTLTLEQIKTLAVPILQKNDVEFAGIFGSYARGEAKPESDIDFLYRYKSPQSLLRTVSIKQALEETLGRTVDLISEKFLNPNMRTRVRNDLQILYGQGRYI